MAATTLTDRLCLTPIDPSDHEMLEQIFAMQSDPATWTHLPQGVERNISQTQAFAEGYAQSWRDFGLGWWLASLREDVGPLPAGKVIGLGGAGVRVPEVPAWNLGYRLTPAAWGQGFASELSRAALVAAHQAQPDLPVVARSLAHNEASWRVLERVGMDLVWEGPVTDPALLTAGLELRVYSDRPLSEELVAAVAALG